MLSSRASSQPRDRFIHGFRKSNPWLVLDIVSSAFPIYLMVTGDSVIVLVCSCCPFPPWSQTVPMFSVAVSETRCESRYGSRSGLWRGTTCCKSDFCHPCYLLWDREATRPCRGEAAGFIFAADVSHCRAIVTIMKEDYAVLGLWRVYWSVTRVSGDSSSQQLGFIKDSSRQLAFVSANEILWSIKRILFH